jgi:hypothetical protein
MGTLRIAALAALAFATATPARAADTTVTTVGKPTTIDAWAGRAVWSTWDPAVSAFRLTVYHDGRTRLLPVAPSPSPFQADLGPGPNGGTVAIYSRCREPVTFTNAGKRGCDLFLYRFATGRESKLAAVNSKFDEEWPTVWGHRLAFVRIDPGTTAARHRMYWRAARRTHRLHDGPKDIGVGFPEELDMRGGRVAFRWQYEWGADLSLSTVNGRNRLLVRMPGSGAEVFDLTAQGPTVGRHTVHWALSVGQDTPTFSEIRRVELHTLNEQRATTRINTPEDRVARATTGFAQDRGTSWYVRVPRQDVFEIHRATGLKYEDAPPPRPPHG